MIKVYKCKRCAHEWAARKPDKPTICPKCKSPYWNKERKTKLDITGIARIK